MCSALYVTTIEHNILRPLIFSEPGIKCNDTPKIHVKDTGVDDHDFSFTDINLLIPLQLWGI